ncbi:hypothetical protein [Pararobbsia silviterrae]|uniref:hypothetical protein n=1 Tax=Pararobbsia silviterrae TaxID=1792498 RepID=UPI00197CC008|nr:hypothetical protein [Pararobbsia silviterrae]
MGESQAVAARDAMRKPEMRDVIDRRVRCGALVNVRIDDAIVAVVDLKADRERRALTIQQWTWVGHGSAGLHKARIDDALHAFEQFQFGD